MYYFFFFCCGYWLDLLRFLLAFLSFYEGRHELSTALLYWIMYGCSFIFQFVKIFTAATEENVPDRLLLGAHARQDTLERFVKEVSIVMYVRSTLSSFNLTVSKCIAKTKLKTPLEGNVFARIFLCKKNNVGKWFWFSKKRERKETRLWKLVSFSLQKFKIRPQASFQITFL